MKSSPRRSHTHMARWGLCSLPIAPPEIVLNYAPYLLGVALLLSGFHLLMNRSFRAGSLLIGTSLAVILSAGVTGW
jgi:hypothetical protein